MAVRRSTLVVLTLFVAVNVANLALFGVRSGGDTPIYTDAATAALHGAAMLARAKSYVGYWGLLAALRLIGLPFTAVVAVQCLLAACAVLATMSLGRVVGGERTALLAGLLVAGNPELAKWNAYLLTDSVYISLVAIVAWATWKAARDGGWYNLLAAGASIAVALQRPNGWALVPVSAVFWLLVRVQTPRARVVAVAGVVVAFTAAALLFSGNALVGRQPDEMLQRGEVIWNYPEGRLAMPVEPPAEHHGWGALAGYAARHPIATTRLFVWRVVVELAHARPFYATAHNVLAMFVLLPLYALVVFGVRLTRNLAATALLLAIIAVHVVMIAISYADWDGRFLLHFWAPLAVLAGRGADALLPTQKAEPVVVIPR